MLEKIKDLESGSTNINIYPPQKKDIIHNNNKNNINSINIIEETKNDNMNKLNKNKNKDNYIINNIDIDVDEDINNNININLNQNIQKDYYKRLHNNFNKIERPQTAMIAEQLNNPKINSLKMQRCANCQKEVLESEFVSHSLICLRHTFRCKKCGELINEKDKKQHLEKYRNPKKIYNSIINNNLDEFILILEHGLKSDDIIEQINGAIYTILYIDIIEFFF